MKERVIKSELKLEGIGRTVPPAELHLLDDGTILFRYLVEGSDYPGFDDRWREVTKAEQHELLCMGGRIADWLKENEGRFT